MTLACVYAQVAECAVMVELKALNGVAKLHERHPTTNVSLLLGVAGSQPVLPSVWSQCVTLCPCVCICVHVCMCVFEGVEHDGREHAAQ